MMMEDFDQMDDFMNVETEADERDAPAADINLLNSFPFLPLDGAFDINSCLPQTPFYEAPFADAGSQEIDCSSSEQEGGGRNQHDHEQPLLSSPTNLSASQPSRSLLSERNRRGRMKEKLLALRSLVPNITKMDKASIIGDATAYVQELQKEATKLSEEIVKLECLKGGGGSRCELLNFYNPTKATNTELESSPCEILQMDVIHVDNCEFYIKIIFKAVKGAVVGLLQALESLKHLAIQSSNLAIHGENFTFSFTIRITERGEGTDRNALKSSLVRIFKDQGTLSWSKIKFLEASETLAGGDEI